MTTTQHTTGPWKAVETARDWVGGKIDGADGKSVAAIAATSNRPGGEKRANAHLIAAAPDMLAALDAWLIFARTPPSDDDMANNATIPIAEFRRAMELTKNAIAKAEGREE